MARPDDAPPLSSSQRLWLLLTSVACWLPLMPHLPDWLAGISGLLLLWHAQLQWRRAPLSALPRRALLTLLTLGGSLAIAAHYQTLLGRSTGVALLALLVTLKLLESRTRRDGVVLTLLASFMLMSQFIYAQDLLHALAMLLGVLLIVTTLAVLEHDGHPPRAALQLAGRMMLQSIPLMLILFLLFPRIQSPLWGLPADAFGGMTGLSDTMTPGNISQLSQSDAIAFRVQFHGKAESTQPTRASLPAQSTLYWRGPVLDFFDGRTWKPAIPAESLIPPKSLKANRSSASSSSLPYLPTGPVTEYTLTLEPHNKHWLFALELPAAMPEEVVMTRDFQLLSRQPVRGRSRYELQAVSPARQQAGRQEAPTALKAALQLPTDFNPRTRALVAEWRKQLGDNPRALVQRTLEHFRNEAFYYTLMPPLLGEDSVDDFLFRTRRGFCEHYASAFVFILRTAGVPARVVTGYQGGEINPVDGTLIVRQSDAHAWAEVWLAEQGWQRVDPTAAIAPARVERNLASALPEGEPIPLLSRAQFSWLQAARFRWEAVANTWNQWVIGYNQQRQRSLLAGLGLESDDWKQMAAVFTSLIGLLLLAYLLWALRQQQPDDPLSALWQKLAQRLEKRGLAPLPWEGPLDYAQRIPTLLPEQTELAEELQDIARSWARLRYAAAESKTAAQNDYRKLKRRIARLPHRHLRRSRNQTRSQTL